MGELQGLKVTKKDMENRQIQEERINNEFRSKNIHSSSEIMLWLDNELPNMGDYSNLSIPSTRFEPQVRQLLSLADDESIFLIFLAATELPSQEIELWREYDRATKTVGSVIFTSEKLLATSFLAARLLSYAMISDNPKLEADDRIFIKEAIQKHLKEISRSHLIYVRLFTKPSMTYRYPKGEWSLSEEPIGRQL